ncbi:hypothetical protein [Fibrobacter sp. UBA4297]|uniref:hypothetical protein n=1 Tax=Fibrobacter sp. UBA4297 TaxID=1946536 RepID=UPI0025C63239|nr:hypothetical protein [Fibrobacter sp. UBA4297]
MHFLKLMPIAVTIAAMGFVACGDSSSNAKIESCEVTSQKPLTLETVQQGVPVKIIIDLINGKLVQTFIAGQDFSEQSCRESNENDDYENVYCMGNKLITTSKESYTQTDFNKIEQQYISECNDAN